MNPAQRHLVSVWNPSYSRTAMDEHLKVLLEWARNWDEGVVYDEALYVWWGKVRSSNRQKAQAHGDEILVAAAAGRGAEVHLYLTDYRSLYVGEILDVKTGDLPREEWSHAPDYYVDQKLNCDFWFKLGDIRRLVIDDTPLVIAELQKLRNVHYNDRPVSLYGGMVDLPLVVTRPDAISFFDEDDSERLIEGKLWAQFDAGAGTGLGATERDLRENRFGDQLWLALDSGARTFIATGERIYREHRADAAFDFAPVMSSFAKAIEVQANAILRKALQKMDPKLRYLNIDGRSVDLLQRPSLDLGALERAIGEDKDRFAALGKLLHNGKWFTESFPAIIGDFREVRNPGTHASAIDRDTATRWRERLIGVGCAGDLIELARTVCRPERTLSSRA